MANIKYEIKETLGAISESSKGWTKELNLIMALVPGTCGNKN